MIRNFFINLILSAALLSPWSGVGGTNTLPFQQVLGFPQAKPAVNNSFKSPQKINNDSVGIKLSCQAAAVVDMESGQILFAKDIDRQIILASVTKLMTAMVWLDQKRDFNQEIEITSKDKSDGGIAYVFPGEKFLAKDLFAASLIASANDATAALVRNSGLSSEQFVSQMNQKAKDLGLSRTEFFDPVGLNPKNVSTAKEAAVLTLAALGRKEIKETVARSEYELKPSNKEITRKIKSTNELLAVDFSDKFGFEIIGGKTGHLSEAGYNLVTSVSGTNGRRIIVAALGASSAEERFSEVKKMAYWTFQNYQWP